MVQRLSYCLGLWFSEIVISVKIQKTYSGTERPYAALLYVFSVLIILNMQ